MSQNTQEKQNPKNAPTSEHKKQEPPIRGLSPDEPFPADPDGSTGKPAQMEK